MKSISHIFIFLLSASLLCSGLMLPIRAKPDTQTDPYTQALLDKGFPLSYAQKLTELHYLHPAWEFDPLPITEMKAQYTWEYVLGKETENPKTNLIHKSDRYLPYRHATNTELYDSGWYQASAQTVAYFMDPENFLNEKDVFMFQDLMYADTVSQEVVERALDGTFMENAVLYDDVTYAAYLIEVGKALNVDPLHLAARLRQEQGTTGNSPLIKGSCGDKLWYYYENQIQNEDGKNILAPTSGHTQDELLAYNGLYNYFNIGAAGTGYFAIYLGAMKEAQKGTAEMAEAWGGSSAWDTPAKAIYGGAYKLTNKYVGDYQNTLYLQKFNVDPRSSRNFWGQYMQNVGAAVSEARTMFNSLYALDCLDLPYHFLIPIYEGKPESNPDPAEGACDTYAAANSMVKREFALLSPVQTQPVLHDALYLSELTMIEGESMQIKANAFVSLVYDAFLIRIDGQAASVLSAEHDPAAAPTRIEANMPDGSLNTWTFDCSSLPVGDHTLSIYGRLANPGKACPHYLLAVLHLHVDPVPETTTEATSEATTEVTTQTATETEPPSTEPEQTTARQESTAEPPEQTQSSTTQKPTDTTTHTPNRPDATYGPGAAQGARSCKSLATLSLPLCLMLAVLVFQKKK